MSKSIEQAIRKITGGTFASVDYTTPNHGLQKGSKVLCVASPNPFWADKADIVKVVKNSQINLGVIYGNAVNGRLAKKGEVETDFISKPMKGKSEHPNAHKNLCVSDKTGNTLVRYMPMGNRNMTVTYMLHGKDITEQVKCYKKPRYEAKRQADAGLDKDEQIVWRTLELGNVDAIRILGDEVLQD